MSDRVELRDFEAVELFRAALVRFIETANGALVSAEVEISRTMNWLDGEQIPHWKSLMRKTAEDLERAKVAYREKKNYKDSSGARQSAIDELKILRRIEAKRAEVEKRAKATRTNLRQLQREATMYHGSAHHLRAAVNGKLAVAAQELRGVVEQLERYVQVAPEALAPELAAGGMARTWTGEPGPDGGDAGDAEMVPGAQLAPAASGAAGDAATAMHDGASDDVALARMLRALTPSPGIRRSAMRADFIPPLPEVPVEATESLRQHLKGSTPGRYDLVTTSVSADETGGDVYLHRTAPAGAGDSGWHIGSVRPQEEIAACVTITAGRLAARRPELEALLAMPQGSLLIANGGRLVLAVDGAEQLLWRAPWPAGED